ncbi:MAG TPA: HPF/RaiA family ribosome-associated protein [Acidimicrobiales bacterium]|nr:HPF/RaiA family ribosome-associated protein [Acidimicrobiales bacterium]
MPEGVVQWLDTSAGEVAVVRKGRPFRARITDVEPEARHVGARVHFDIRHDQGRESAVDVRLRTWTSRRHRNVGTLVAARRPDTKGPATYEQAHPRLAALSSAHPLAVAQEWAANVADGDRDGAVALYAPEPVLHLEPSGAGTATAETATAETATGRDRAAGFVERMSAFGRGRRAKVRGLDGEALVGWEPAGPDEPAVSVRCRISHGQIAEQWLEEPTAWTAGFVQEAPSVPPIVLVTWGDVGEEDKRYASERILALAEHIGQPILFARVKLARAPDPARVRPAMAQVTLDVNGEPVRAHVAAHTIHEAVDLVQRRLRDRLEHVASHRAPVRELGVPPEPGEWRHGDRATERPTYFPRPVEDRQLVRHKTFSMDELTPDEAVYDMEQLDYDFHLFSDLATGSDSVIERLEGGKYRLTRLEPVDVGLGAIGGAIEISVAAVPRMSVDEAIERLDAGGEPFVFFADASTGRGNVVYRRYDGHYGLIAPS